jgi:hypothetical protein
VTHLTTCWAISNWNCQGSGAGQARLNKEAVAPLLGDASSSQYIAGGESQSWLALSAYESGAMVGNDEETQAKNLCRLTAVRRAARTHLRQIPRDPHFGLPLLPSSMVCAPSCRTRSSADAFSHHRKEGNVELHVMHVAEDDVELHTERLERFLEFGEQRFTICT